jgi:chitin deacetylase
MFFETSAFYTLAVATLVSLTSAAPHAHHNHGPIVTKRNSLMDRWYQDPNGQAAQLFKRATTDAAIGTPEWRNAYPAPGSTPGSDKIPQAWKDRLAEVKKSSAWPTYGPSNPNNGYPLYTAPNGTKLEGKDPNTVCSFTYECHAPSDIFDGPDGVIGLNFDDGPTQFSGELYDFIEANNISATHFMIGGNIVNLPDVFQRAWNDGGKSLGLPVSALQQLTRFLPFLPFFASLFCYTASPVASSSP